MSTGKTEDDFADIINSYNGVFGENAGGLDSGLARHDQVDVAVTDQGAVLEFRCPGCGRMRRLEIDYPELVALKYRISPHLAFRSAPNFCADPSAWRWVRDEHKWGLQMRCNFCPYHYPVRLAAHEPEAMLGKARRAGYINTAAEQQVMAHCNAIVQQYRRQQQRRR